MCKNPNCPYVHPNLPQKNQLKWTASNSTETLTAGTSENTLKTQESSSNLESNPNSQAQPMLLSA